MTRIGIFLCTCDGKIENQVQVDAFQYVMRTNPDVALVQPMATVCLPAGVHALKDAIHTHHLDRVVVAGCPERFQENHLRDECMKAGVNLNYFALVDWREGCAQVHDEDKQTVTGKAIDLVQMAVGRVSKAQPVEQVRVKIEQPALVIGGGIAGMTAARSLADRGIAVTLLEREMTLGGQLREVPLAEHDMALAYNETLTAVLSHSNIQVRLNSRVVAVDSLVGNYRVKICSPGPPEQPAAPALASDASAASEAKRSPLEREGGSSPRMVATEHAFGAIVVATGAQEFRAAELHRYDGRRVVTLGEFESRLLGHEYPSSVVYILCAGSRDARTPYCSNVCCLNALNQAVRIKRVQSDTRVTMLFRDLYLRGDESNEEVVLQARHLGVEFVRYTLACPPRVGKDSVEVRDEVTNATRRIECDRVVLATPLVPHDDASALARFLNLPRDDDGFFVDPHHRVRPEQQVEQGVFVCGAAHRPVDMDTAMLQGMTAAARAARFIQQGEVSRPAFGAWVDPQLCTGCAQCVEACTFGAIQMVPPTLPRRAEGFDRSIVDPFLCQSCGNCVVACPSKAIDLPGSSDAQIFAQMDAALAARHNGSAPVLVFGCHWSGFAAMELAGARGLRYPAQTRAIELPCSARLDPLHVLYALCNGAAAVVLALCPPAECHFGSGNRHAEARVEKLRAELALHGIAPQRLRIARMMGDDAQAWVRAVAQSANEISGGLSGAGLYRSNMKGGSLDHTALE
jgi:heterodisulfide reductase subunit A2